MAAQNSRHLESFAVDQPPPRDSPQPASFPAGYQEPKHFGFAPGFALRNAGRGADADASCFPLPAGAPTAEPLPANAASFAPSAAAGDRIPLVPGQPFPSDAQAGAPPFRDADGTPVYLGSAWLREDAVHPCKIAPALKPAARVPYGGKEYAHAGRFDLLRFDPDRMEWASASGGTLPTGRKPVDGGFEQGGGRLFHAYATVDGVQVPGKAGEHLGGVNVAFGGQEHIMTRDYHVLVWK